MVEQAYKSRDYAFSQYCKHTIFVFCMATLSLFTTSNSACQELRVSTGSVITHIVYELAKKDLYFHPCPQGGGKLTEEKPFTRVVVRPQVCVTYVGYFNSNKYYAVGVFTGKDCLHGPIFGMSCEIGMGGKILLVGLTAGGYFRDKDLWDKYQFKNPKAFIPLVGLNITVKKDFKHVSVGLENRITPILLTHNIYLSYKL